MLYLYLEMRSWEFWLEIIYFIYIFNKHENHYYEKSKLWFVVNTQYYYDKNAKSRWWIVAIISRFHHRTVAFSPLYFRCFVILTFHHRTLDIFTSVISCFHPYSSFAFHDCGFAFLLFAGNRNKRICALNMSTKTPVWFESRWKILCYFSYWNMFIALLLITFLSKHYI